MTSLGMEASTFTSGTHKAHASNAGAACRLRHSQCGDPGNERLGSTTTHGQDRQANSEFVAARI
jgi:hypothetical protein